MVNFFFALQMFFFKSRSRKVVVKYKALADFSTIVGGHGVHWEPELKTNACNKYPALKVLQWK